MPFVSGNQEIRQNVSQVTSAVETITLKETEKATAYGKQANEHIEEFEAKEENTDYNNAAVINADLGIEFAYTAYNHGMGAANEATKINVKQDIAENVVSDSLGKGKAAISLGTFKITHYAGDTQTSTGAKPTVGRTIAVDPKVIPYGSIVIVDGHSYVAEDCGGAIKGKRLDIFVASESEAYRKGIKHRTVQVIFP